MITRLRVVILDGCVLRSRLGGKGISEFFEMGTILGFGYTTNGCRHFKKEGAWCRDFKKEGLRVSVTRVQG
jgi:hypothetical protein